MNNFKSFLFILVVSFFFNSLALAEHLKGESKAEKDGYLKKRIIDLPAAFKKVQISPAGTVKTLNKELIENKNTKKIDKNIKNKSLLSVLYFDGQKIVVDKISEKIQDNTSYIVFLFRKVL